MTSQLLSIAVYMQRWHCSVVRSRIQLHSGRFSNRCTVLQHRQHLRTFAMHSCELITQRQFEWWANRWHARRVQTILHCCTRVKGRFTAGKQVSHQHRPVEFESRAQAGRVTTGYQRASKGYQRPRKTMHAAQEMLSRCRTTRVSVAIYRAAMQRFVRLEVQRRD